MRQQCPRAKYGLCKVNRIMCCRYTDVKFFFKMAAGRHLRFDPTGNNAVRSAVPENPTLEQTRSGSDDP